jgi:hypothetical protein
MSRAMSRAMAGQAASLVARSNEDPPAHEPAVGYFQRSQTPLTNLMFLLPLLLAYELGTRQFVQNPILAFALMQRFLSVFFGDGAKYLPFFAIVGTLIGTHLARKDPLQVRLGDLWKMALESILLGLPLLLLWMGAGPYLVRVLYPGPAVLSGWAVPCIGAGIYEEFLFRMIVMNVLSLLLVGLLQLPTNWANAAIVISSAMMFAGYHYLGSEKFLPITFVFRTIAGLYFAAIFLCRGLGITCGSHASYDMIAIGLRLMR